MANQPEQEDLRQIGLTPEGKEHLEAVMASGWFEDRQDAYRTAIALALAEEVIASPEQVKRAITAYNFLGGIDRDGHMRMLITTFRPEGARWPARTAERLAHAGLTILAERLAGEDCLISQALGYENESHTEPAAEPESSRG
jgi:hypothetical protein